MTRRDLLAPLPATDSAVLLEPAADRTRGGAGPPATGTPRAGCQRSTIPAPSTTSWDGTATTPSSAAEARRRWVGRMRTV